jgi:acyl-CoA reductase-like NAD-dependent aldehyde dehydrogenase
MILNPSEQAPLAVIRIVEILSQILPKGVVQIVPGFGPEVPQALVAHPLVKMVSFTGSTIVGSKVGESAAQKPIPVVLELGGKNALVVFNDADLNKAAAAAVAGAFFNKGEACTATSRILVQRGIHDRFCDLLAAGVRKLKVGDGMDPSTHVGPLVTKIQQTKVLGYLELAKQMATITAQADLPTDPECAAGFFVPPTLVTGVTRDMVLAQEEMFGPLVTVTAFDIEDEAVSIVNESRYGLTSCIFSRDIEKCLRIARKVDVGMVFINNYDRMILGTPFGGNKDSGFGREHCIETLRSWQNTKLIKQPSGLRPVLEWRGAVDIFGPSNRKIDGLTKN